MKKKLLTLFFLCFVAYASAQTMVLEMTYNVNGVNYNGLCVIENSTGIMNVFGGGSSSTYTAVYINHGTHETITTSNSTNPYWIPGVYTFYPNGQCCVFFNGYQYPLYVNIIPIEYWEDKMRQYGLLDGYY